MNPLLSVIVPVYNVRPYMDECIDSILSQTYTNFELLLIDDGSTDGSGKRCDFWAKQDFRIKVVHQKNKGQSSARNRGISEASGEYLWFIDSDDYITPSSLFEELIMLQVANNYSFIQIPFIKSGISYNVSNNICITDKYKMYMLWINGKHITNYLCDKIWSKEIFKDLRLKEGVIFEDRHIFSECLNRCDKILIYMGGGDIFIEHGQGKLQKEKEILFS